jgi:hypothetical protein
MPDLVLTEDAVVVCDHAQGMVRVAVGQDLVRIAGRRVLVAGDPVGRPVAGCIQAPPLKPCTSTLLVQAGHSALVRIGGRPLVLASLDGITDGTPPGAVHFRCRRPGQAFVAAA